MLYSVSYPVLLASAYLHQKYNWLLVFLKRRPKLLLRTFVRPENHYNKICYWLKKTDIELLSRLSVPLAARYTQKLFEKPTRMPCMAQDEEFERESFMAEFKFKGYNINVFHHDPRRIGKEWNGKTLLLLHGWEGRSVMFKPLIKQLTACGYRLVLPDLLAHGSSEGSRCSFYELADLIVEVDQRFGPFDTAVGHSFGGTALAIAIDQGMKIDKMITIGSPNGFGNMLNAYIDYYGYPAVLKSYLKDMYRRKNGRHPDDIGPTLWNRLTLPTLICHDSHDVVINVREAHAMHECFPNSELFISTGKGHRGVLKDTKLHQKIIEFI